MTPAQYICEMYWQWSTPSLWSIKRTLTSRMFALFILRVLSRLRTKRTKAKARREKVPPMYSVDASSKSPPDSPLSSATVLRERRDYCELAQRLRPLLPLACNRLGSDDVLIIDTRPFSSGCFSEVWQGTLQGLLVVVKSLRFYASPEFDPAEVGVVSARTSAQLKQY